MSRTPPELQAFELAVRSSSLIASGIAEVNDGGHGAMVLWPATIRVMLEGKTFEFDFVECQKQSTGCPRGVHGDEMSQRFRLMAERAIKE